jgi:hypothetical protein
MEELKFFGDFFPRSSIVFNFAGMRNLVALAYPFQASVISCIPRIYANSSEAMLFTFEELYITTRHSPVGYDRSLIDCERLPSRFKW